MAGKKKLTGTVTLTLKVKQTDGPIPETLDALKEQLETDWDGLEVYFADPDLEEETVAKLTIEKFEVVTG